MNDNIDKGEIRKAIDRLQAEHPCHITFDVTLFNNGTDFSVMQRTIDMVAKKCQDDADIHIICEMAKLYLDGVTPTVERPQWIPCSERVPKESGYYIVQTDGSHGHVIDIAEFGRLWSKKCEDFGWGWNKASRVIAWMPLPEPYRGEDEPHGS